MGMYSIINIWMGIQWRKFLSTQQVENLWSNSYKIFEFTLIVKEWQLCICLQKPVKREKLLLLLLSQLFLGEKLVEELLVVCIQVPEEGAEAEADELLAARIQAAEAAPPQLEIGCSTRLVTCWRSTHSKVRSVDFPWFCFWPDSWARLNFRTLQCFDISDVR